LNTPLPSAAASANGLTAAALALSSPSSPAANIVVPFAFVDQEAAGAPDDNRPRNNKGIIEEGKRVKAWRRGIYVKVSIFRIGTNRLVYKLDGITSFSTAILESEEKCLSLGKYGHYKKFVSLPTNSWHSKLQT
jgi:hypothetical protein